MRFDQHTLVLLVTPVDARDLPDDEAAAVQNPAGRVTEAACGQPSP